MLQKLSSWGFVLPLDSAECLQGPFSPRWHGPCSQPLRVGCPQAVAHVDPEAEEHLENSNLIWTLWGPCEA